MSSRGTDSLTNDDRGKDVVPYFISPSKIYLNFNIILYVLTWTLLSSIYPIPVMHSLLVTLDVPIYFSTIKSPVLARLPVSAVKHSTTYRKFISREPQPDHNTISGADIWATPISQAVTSTANTYPTQWVHALSAKTKPIAPFYALELWRDVAAKISSTFIAPLYWT